MFVILDGTIYHTRNANEPVEDYLFLCGLFFPLVKSETIVDFEKRYMEKNSEKIRNFMENETARITSNTKFLGSLEKEVKQNKCLSLFLSEIVPIYIGDRIDRLRLNELKDDESILENILGGNAAIINQRVFPLSQKDFSSILKVNGKNYCFEASRKTIKIVEDEFQTRLSDLLKKKILYQLKKSDEVKQRLLELEGQIRELGLRSHISRAGSCYEYSDIGYDPELQRVYCLFLPHRNKTTKRKYKEGQGAISVGITPNGLNQNAKAIYREDIESKFNIENVSLCLGIKPQSSSNQHMVHFLMKVAENTQYQGALHE